MKKMKIYLDSSVISHLEALDTPEKMQDTVGLWVDIKVGEYDIVLSEMVFVEIDRCHNPKRDMLYHSLSEIEYTTIEINDEVEKIAEQIISLGILKRNSIDDCTHIACAIFSGCNYLVSWNFKHMVNVKTINGVRAITNLNGYNSIDIITPSMLVCRED